MIYFKYKDNTTSAYDFHYQVGQTNNISAYHIETTDINRVIGLGLGIQTITLTAWVYQKTELNLRDIVQISFDNTTWQDVLGYRITQWSSVKTGRRLPLGITFLVSPLRIGAEHEYSEQWDGSISISHNGNYKAIPKIIIRNPQVYLPLDTSITGIYGNYLDFTAPAREYGGVSYNENEPIFDEGLYLSSDETIKLNLSHTIPEYTIFLKLKYKGGSEDGNILTFNGAVLKWTNTTTLTLSTSNDYSVAFPQTDYEAGKTVAVIITMKLDGSGTLNCGIIEDGVLSSVSSTSFTDTTLPNLSGEIDVGGTTGHSISDFAIYPYSVDNSTNKAWNMTTEPIEFSRLYIENTVSGTITFEDGVLTDSDGNNVSYLVSGTIPVADPDLTLEKSGGISGLWSVTVKDTYFP